MMALLPFQMYVYVALGHHRCEPTSTSAVSNCNRFSSRADIRDFRSAKVPALIRISRAGLFAFVCSILCLVGVSAPFRRDLGHAVFDARFAQDCGCWLDR